MAKINTGTVDLVDRTTAAKKQNPVLQLTLDGATRLRAGDRVSLTEILSDEAIGRKLRTILNKDIRRASLVELARSIEDEAGWPILADLVRAVIDGEDDS